MKAPPGSAARAKLNQDLQRLATKAVTIYAATKVAQRTLPGVRQVVKTGPRQAFADAWALARDNPAFRDALIEFAGIVAGRFSPPLAGVSVPITAQAISAWQQQVPTLVHDLASEMVGELQTLVSSEAGSENIAQDTYDDVVKAIQDAIEDEDVDQVEVEVSNADMEFAMDQEIAEYGGDAFPPDYGAFHGSEGNPTQTVSQYLRAFRSKSGESKAAAERRKQQRCKKLLAAGKLRPG
jgi:hypothetical protein